MCYKVLLYVSCRAWPAVNPTTPPRSKPAHRPWWLPPSRTCPACWCGWWCWCWAGRPRWGGWRWRRATAAGSAGSTSTPAGWPGSRGWSCWAPRRSCGRGWSLEEEKGRGDSLSVRTRGSGNWGCNSYGNNGVLCNKEDALGLLKNFFFPVSSVRSVLTLRCRDLLYITDEIRVRVGQHCALLLTGIHPRL